MSRSELAVLSCLRDSAQLSTLPAWCRGELSTAADLIDQLRKRVAEVEDKRDLNARMLTEELTRNEHLEAKLALAEQLLREARGYIDDSYGPYQDICSRIDAAIDASGHDSLPPHKGGVD